VAGVAAIRIPVKYGANCGCSSAAHIATGLIGPLTASPAPAYVVFNRNVRRVILIGSTPITRLETVMGYQIAVVAVLPI
jgi:hypothetical protein